jgi:Carboxypeptidase regulatory-like domain
MKKLLLLGLAFLVFGFGPAVWAQRVSGNLAVTIQDDSGTPVPKANIRLVNPATGFAWAGTANAHGEYLFSDLPPGPYNITVTAAGFAKYEKTGFPVQLSRTNAVTFSLIAPTEKVTSVTRVAPPPLDLTTLQIAGTFESKETNNVPTATVGLGVVNLSLLQPGVGSSGGLGSGTGPAVGGQRPTNNNFTIEGADNNSKSATGPVAKVPNDAVAEFTSLQNVFSPEFGLSDGGQFNQILVTGTNKYHGKAYVYNQNRNYDAADQQAVVNGIEPLKPRYDNNRFGGQVGGPVPLILKDKLFFFANGEYNPLGQSSFHAGGMCAPTTAGFAQLEALPPGANPNTVAGGMVSVNATNLRILQTYLPAAPTATSSMCPLTAPPPGLTAANPTNADVICTGGAVPMPPNPAQPIPHYACPSGETPTFIDVGVLGVTAPNYTNNYYLASGVDYNRSKNDQYRIRYVYNRFSTIDTEAEVPAFYLLSPLRNQLVSVSEYHTFRPDLTNELRLAYSRFSDVTPSGNFLFTGLDKFPNFVFADINAQLGPDPQSPRSAIVNDYQASENVNLWHKKHNIRAGFELRRYIAPTGLTQNARGNYQYSSLGTYLYDINPDILAERSAGSETYYGDLIDSGIYVNDTWRIKPWLSINYGLRYDYATVPFGERQQTLNSAANVLGLISWNEPRAPKNEFMPRAGFAWSPNQDRTWVIRAGIIVNYDVLYDNLGLNTVATGGVPQLGSTINRDQATEAAIGVPNGIINNFLLNGGILPTAVGFNTFGACPPPTPCGTTGTGATALANQQAATSGQIPINVNNPKAISYTGGIQHVFRRNYTVDVHYIGTHGYLLPVPINLNRQAATSSTAYLPTYLTAPAAGTLAALSNTVSSLLTATPLNSFVPAFVAGCAIVSGQKTDGLLPNSMGQLAPAPCFTSSITSYQPAGDSIYRGVAAQVTRRFEHGLQFNASYTYSTTKDDTSSAFPNSVINPVRPQDDRNLKSSDWGYSAFDHRNRFTLLAYYEPPFFKSGSRLRQDLLGNWFFVPVYTFQSGGWADLQSFIDGNLNGDTGGDRVLVNPSGVAGTGSAVTPTCLIAGTVIVGTGLAAGKEVTCTPANTLAYTAVTSTARYIQAQQGALQPNNLLQVAQRNSLPLRPINNLDLTAGKKIPITERFKIELEAQVLNALNHPQYIPGSINQANSVVYTSTAASNFVNPASTNFDNPAIAFSSNPRVIQIAAKFIF